MLSAAQRKAMIAEIAARWEAIKEFRESIHAEFEVLRLYRSILRTDDETKLRLVKPEPRGDTPTCGLRVIHGSVRRSR